MKPSEVLRKALKKFGPDGEHWTNYPSSGKRNCALLALQDIDGSMLAIKTAAYPYLVKAAGVKDGKLGAWNDKATFADVRDAYEKAIALAEQEEACTPATHSSNF